MPRGHGGPTVVTVPQVISSEQVRSAVAEVLGYEVRRVTRLSGSVANQDFVVESVNDLRLVLKAGPETEIAAEAWACGRLATVGVPVPLVLFSELGSARLGSAFLIAGFVAGEPTSDGDVIRDLGACFRRVHGEQLPGWGPVVISPGTVPNACAAGRYSSWRGAVDASLAGVPQLVAAGILSKVLADNVRRAIDPLDYDGPGVLLHNDLKPAHVFGRMDHGRGRLSAVIDWGDASVGDPAADLARLSMAGQAAMVAFLEGYGGRLTDDLQDRLTRYRILWNVASLSYEFQAGGDWFDTYRDRISEDTGRLLA